VQAHNAPDVDDHEVLKSNWLLDLTGQGATTVDNPYQQGGLPRTSSRICPRCVLRRTCPRVCVSLSIHPEGTQYQGPTLVHVRAQLEQLQDTLMS
jgi:hypothetical protein